MKKRQSGMMMAEELAITGAEMARIHYGARGWVLHQNTDLWRVAAPMDGPSWGGFTTGGAWLSTHLWEHYLYTGDRAFLEARYLRSPADLMQVAGQRLHVRDTGPRDASTVLLIHGFGANLHTWEPWAQELSKTHRVVRFDLPGSGPVVICAKGIEAALRKLAARPSLPPHLDPAIVDDLPDTPGVYLFFGEGRLPLYIGKSVNPAVALQAQPGVRQTKEVAQWLCFGLERTDGGIQSLSRTQEVVLPAG